MRLLIGVLCLVVVVGGVVLLLPSVRDEVKALMLPEEPPPLTPLAVMLPPTIVASTPTAVPSATSTASSTPTPVAASPTAPANVSVVVATPSTVPSATEAPTPTSMFTATALPLPTPTRGPVEVNGRWYDAYIPAASKPAQAYQYSCEFDAAWVILQTYGIAATVDDLIALVGVDTSVEPYIEETEQGYVIHGGNIADSFSGNFRDNFLARSSATAILKAFNHYGLRATLVSDRASVESALRNGSLVWIKTTVDFKSWRDATWVMPDGRTHRTVLGNDHAVVVMGYSERGAVIRDVLGPTSSNEQRPYEYEVDWSTFLASWEAQSFDGVAVDPPNAP